MVSPTPAIINLDSNPKHKTLPVSPKKNLKILNLSFQQTDRWHQSIPGTKLVQELAWIPEQDWKPKGKICRCCSCTLRKQQDRRLPNCKKALWQLGLGLKVGANLKDSQKRKTGYLMLFLTPRTSELQLLQKHSIACKGASSLGLHILPREATPEFHTAQRDHHPHRCCCYPDHCSRPAVHHHAPCLQIIRSRLMRTEHAKLLLLAELRSSRFAVRRKASARPDWTTQHPPVHHEGMNDKWSWDSFLLGSGSVDNHGSYLRFFCFTIYLPTY
jgi:hypothetical protein